MRIIDPHVHIWKNYPDFPYAVETVNPPINDATPEMLLELMQANGVEKTVLVQVIHYRWDNTYTAYALKMYPDKFMGVCHVNPNVWINAQFFQTLMLSNAQRMFSIDF